MTMPKIKTRVKGIAPLATVPRGVLVTPCRTNKFTPMGGVTLATSQLITNSITNQHHTVVTVESIAYGGFDTHIGGHPTYHYCVHTKATQNYFHVGIVEGRITGFVHNIVSRLEHQVFYDLCVPCANYLKTCLSGSWEKLGKATRIHIVGPQDITGEDNRYPFPAAYLHYPLYWLHCRLQVGDVQS